MVLCLAMYRGGVTVALFMVGTYLLSFSPRLSQDAIYWRNSAARLIGCCFFLAVATNKSISDVTLWLNSNNLEEVIKQLKGLGGPESVDIIAIAEVLDMAQSIQDRPEKEMLTAFSMASAMFSIFYDYSVLESAMTPTFSPLEFLENKVTLLLINPSATPDRVAPLF